MYAVIISGGKQYRVSEGDTIEVEKLNANVGDKVELETVIKVDGDKIEQGGKAVAEVLKHGKDRKIVVFKYKPKKNERRKQGHRQPFSVIKILSV